MSGIQASSVGGRGSGWVLRSEDSSNSSTLPSQTWMSVHWAPTTALRLRPATTFRAVSAACASSVHQTMSVSQKRECLQPWCDPGAFTAAVPQAKWQVLPATTTSYPFPESTMKRNGELSMQKEGYHFKGSRFDLEMDMNDHSPGS